MWRVQIKVILEVSRSFGKIMSNSVAGSEIPSPMSFVSYYN